jgi:hypothetical protein
MKRKKITLLFTTLSFSCAAWADFTDELRFDASNAHYWSSRAENLKQIERYMYRNLNLQHPSIQEVRPALENGRISQYNQMAYQDSFAELENDPFWSGVSDVGERIDDFLLVLPKVELTAYQARPADLNAFHRIELGDGFIEPGFMHATGSLHSSVAQMRAELPNEPLLIFKIQSKEGRLISFLAPHEPGAVLWPIDSYFQVVDKNVDTATGTYMIQLQEIDYEAMRALPKTRYMHNYKRFQLGCAPE